MLFFSCHRYGTACNSGTHRLLPCDTECTLCQSSWIAQQTPTHSFLCRGFQVPAERKLQEHLCLCLFCSLLCPHVVQSQLIIIEWLNKCPSSPPGVGTPVDLEFTAHYPSASAFASVFLLVCDFLQMSLLFPDCFLTTALFIHIFFLLKMEHVDPSNQGLSDEYLSESIHLIQKCHEWRLTQLCRIQYTKKFF